MKLNFSNSPNSLSDFKQWKTTIIMILFFPMAKVYFSKAYLFIIIFCVSLQSLN